ncbi:sce7726 family protein [Pseudomonas faucium]|uniref:sce7726 family protein n=1 Tax=Pseudomonas faucium TaxID=2740518 RepID=UPI001596AAE7|nr:sce7726 family protein [Pseudomonas faucium]
MLNPDEIRPLLKQWVTKVMSHEPGDVFIEELCFIDKARRADLVHANGRLTAFEIKSHADTLLRWAGQQDAYLACFDEVWLCCHSRHLVKALEVSAANVGILVVDDFSGMAMVRKAKANRKQEKFHLTGFLWRDELDRLARAHGVQVKSRDLIKTVRQAVSDALSLEQIREFVLSILKRRYS